MFYLGHNLVTSKEIFSGLLDLRFYDCKKCDNLFWLDGDELYYYNLINENENIWHYTTLTCDELVIKLILE